MKKKEMRENMIIQSVGGGMDMVLGGKSQVVSQSVDLSLSIQ
jgi:hypothetical protein